jgi:hypothetical protein
MEWQTSIPRLVRDPSGSAIAADGPRTAHRASASWAVISAALVSAAAAKLALHLEISVALTSHRNSTSTKSVPCYTAAQQLTTANAEGNK